MKWIHQPPTSHTPLLADLEWAITSPPLLHTVSRPHLTPQIESNRTLQLTTHGKLSSFSTTLSEDDLRNRWQREKDKRLGHYFEWLLCQWLNHTHHTVHSNIQISQQRQTIGELDFLLCSQRQIIHWEVAIKFMIAPSMATTFSDLTGLNANDTLAQKWRHMTTKQWSLIRSLPPKHQAACQASLQADTLQQIATIKGWIFYPITAFSTAQHAQPQTNSPLSVNHLRGWWCTQTNSSIIQQNFPCWTWAPLPKTQWLGWGAEDRAQTTDRDFTWFDTPQLMLGCGRQHQWTLVMLLPDDGWF